MGQLFLFSSALNCNRQQKLGSMRMTCKLVDILQIIAENYDDALFSMMILSKKDKMIDDLSIRQTKTVKVQLSV